MSDIDFQFKSDTVCCISDIHIGVHQNSQMWLDICEQWADWLVTELKGKQVKDIIICGDLFHYRDEVAVNTIHYTSKFMKKFKDFNIIMLVGNHDAYYKDRSDVNSLTIFSGWQNVYIVDCSVQTVTHGDKKLSFVPWGVRCKDIPKSDIILGHFEIENFHMNGHFVCKHGVRPAELLKKSDLVVSGHFHKRDQRKYTNGIIQYLGNPFQMDFGDSGQTKGYYLLDITNKQLEFIENKQSPTHQKILLSELVSDGDIKKQTINRIKNNIVRFIVDKNISPDEMDQLLRVLSKHKPLTISTDYNINFDKFGLEDGDADLSGVSIEHAIEEFVNLLDVENKQKIIDYTTNLYNKCK